jgi:hypothetical protein
MSRIQLWFFISSDSKRDRPAGGVGFTEVPSRQLTCNLFKKQYIKRLFVGVISLFMQSQIQGKTAISTIVKGAFSGLEVDFDGMHGIA